MALPQPVCDAVIDVSHNNGAITWPAVVASGVALVFVKASEGTGFVDPLFARNREAALAAGLLVVPYHFIDAGAPAGQARHFIEVAALASGDPAMLDWETRATVEDAVAIGAAVAAATGRDPLFYYGRDQLAASNAPLSGWPLMLPEYPRGDTPGDYASLVATPPRLPPGRPEARPYDFHQYTPAGRVAGIAGPVDRSVWVGTLDQLHLWHRGGTVSAA